MEILNNQTIKKKSKISTIGMWNLMEHTDIALGEGMKFAWRMVLASYPWNQAVWIRSFGILQEWDPEIPNLMELDDQGNEQMVVEDDNLGKISKRQTLKIESQPKRNKRVQPNSLMATSNPSKVKVNLRWKSRNC